MVRPCSRLRSAEIFFANVGGPNGAGTTLSKDSFQITATGVQACSAAGAEKVAFQQAAAETIRKGYDNFMIVGGDRQSQLETASIYGGSASYGHRHSRGLTVKMFKEGDPGCEQAISARETLGPKWQEALKPETSYACT
jgi:hypothetical protein